MKKKYKILSCIILCLIVLVSACLIYIFMNKDKTNTKTIKVDITNLTYTVDGATENIKTYKLDDYDTFVSDFNNNKLPDIYVTYFLFDGAGAYKTYDLDDFIESGNDLDVDTLESTVINIKSSANYELSGELKGGMIAVNTNDLDGDINLILNNVKIDTDSKKIPAIYVYNKDITYDKYKVTITAKENTKNYIEGGKLKKVSLIAKEELSNYTNNYSGESSTWYGKYTNYYGVYSKSEINKVLFATVTADREDLADGDPYYYYKASGAISSDIDLTFDGKGYLEVTSKNKEGIESKGNLSFTGGYGDYVISSQDDCLNTTTDSTENKNAHNDLTINVNSLTAIVSLDADEGDAIDSNGILTINGGTIIALAKPGQDAGLDSVNGTYINGGTVIATGDMYDQINSDSKQNFIVLSFASQIKEKGIIALLDSNEELKFAFETDRSYKTLVFSSKDLSVGTYALYKDGSISGTSNNGLYLSGSYEKGTILGYSSTGMQGGPGGMMGGRNNGNDRMTPPDQNEKSNNSQMTPPEKPDGNNMPNQNDNNNQMTPPEKIDGDNQNKEFANHMENNTNANPTNKDFTINGISNMFSGIGEFKEN